MHDFKPRENNMFAKFKQEKEPDNAAVEKTEPMDEETPDFSEILNSYSHADLAKLRDAIDAELAENESDEEHAMETADDEASEMDGLTPHGDDSEI